MNQIKIIYSSSSFPQIFRQPANQRPIRLRRTHQSYLHQVIRHQVIHRQTISLQVVRQMLVYLMNGQNWTS